MNCQDFLTHLDPWLDGALAEPSAMETHAQQCTHCAYQLMLERRLRQGLRAMRDAVEHDPERNNRLLAVLSSTPAAAPSRGRYRSALAAAACLLAGIAIGVLWSPGQLPSTPLKGVEAVLLEPHRDQYVRLAFRSPSALRNAEIHLQVSDAVQLAGYPNQRELRWTTDLSEGTNMLELPVRLTGSEGRVVATVRYGSGERRFEVDLRARDGQGAQSPSPASPQRREPAQNAMQDAPYA
ncbi:anti-sigma factor family protein [Algiphilus sp.]|uniref:anti-sigma factor family protein n=1 Tax=Algiphilus sp. TaxID=1872431 RepID=UPI003B52E09B